MIQDLKRQGLGVSAIARQTGLDRKTVRKYLARGLEAPEYKRREPRARVIDEFANYLRERIAAFPDLSAKRLMREIREDGYAGGYTSVKEFVREARPPKETRFERRLRRRQANRPRWTSPSSPWASQMSLAWFARSGCSRWFWATAAGSGGVSAQARNCRP